MTINTIKDELTNICKRHFLPEAIKATVREPYMPYIPEDWNKGVLVLAEAQNHGNTKYLKWLNSVSSAKRIQRLYNSPKNDKLGIQPWDDGFLKMAVELLLSINPKKIAVSNACLWSIVDYESNHINPTKELVEKSVLIWQEMLEVLEPKIIITSGKIAAKIIQKLNCESIEWAHPAYMQRISGLFTEKDLLVRYHEVDEFSKEHPHYFTTLRKNKIVFACHVLSKKRIQ